MGQPLGSKKNKTHADITQLWASLDNAIATPSALHIDALAGSVILTSVRYVDSDDLLARTQLAKIWIYMTELRVAHMATERLTYASLKRFFKLLADEDVVDTIMADAAHHSAVVCAAMLVADELQTVNRTEIVELVRDSLKYWLQQDFEVETLISPAALADKLYGPGVWLLYRDDFKTDTEMALHMLKTKAPLAGVHKMLGHLKNDDQYGLPDTFA